METSLPDNLTIEAALECPESEEWLTCYVLAKPMQVSQLFTEGIRPSHFIGPTQPIIDATFELYHLDTLGTSDSIKSELQDRGVWPTLGPSDTEPQVYWNRLKEKGAAFHFDDLAEQEGRPTADSDFQYHVDRVYTAHHLRSKAKTHRQGLEDLMKTSSPLRDRKELSDDTTKDLLKIEARSHNTAHSGDELADWVERTMGSKEVQFTHSTGYPSVDEALDGGVPTSRVSMVAARSNHGKSLFCRWLAMNTAVRYAKNDIDKQVLFIDLENDRKDAVLGFLTICCNWSAKSKSECLEITEVRRHWEEGDYLSGWKKERFDDGLVFWRTIGLHITIDIARGVGHQYVRARMHACEAEKEVGLCVFDYAELSEEEDADGTTESVEIFVKGLHLIAEGYDNCAWVLVAQLDRRVDRREGGKPHLGDLQWSSAQEKQAKVVLLLRHAWQHWNQTGEEFGAEPPKNRLDIFAPKTKGGSGDVPPLKIFPDIGYIRDQNARDPHWQQSKQTPQHEQKASDPPSRNEAKFSVEGDLDESEDDAPF